MFMTETGPAVKRKRKLKAYVFDISPLQWGEGVVVVTAYTTPEAKKLAARETGRQVESLPEPKIIDLDTPRLIAYSYYSE